MKPLSGSMHGHPFALGRDKAFNSSRATRTAAGMASSGSDVRKAASTGCTILLNVCLRLR